METGIIFDIKEFSVFDGPGIRQTIFLKGCPLRCNWCHNPEGLSMEPQLMVSLNSCVHCAACERACPSPGNCIACGKCVDVCPVNIRRIAGEKMTSKELIDLIQKDADYYRSCGGGVTFSGGDPLMQAPFLLEVLRGLRGIHRAVQTSGCFSESVFADIISELEFVMMDLKLMDPESHRHFTGVSNDLILRNAETLMRSGKPVCFRIPLIPGVNDSIENQEQTAAFISRVSRSPKVELLPYHRTAGAKYPMSGMTYEPRFDTEQKIQACPEIFHHHGLECTVL